MRIEGNDQRLAAATAIQLQQTGVQQVIMPRSPQQQDGQNTNKSNTVQTVAGDKVSIQVELPKNTIDTLHKMGNLSDILNSVATNLRQTNEGLKAVNDVTEQMKATLDKIIKFYPPYPIESQDRVKQLMSYSSLQKQIMSLVPAPPPQMVYEKVKHLWEGLTRGTGGSIQTPSLPLDAPDTHVNAAAKQLDVISSQISLVQGLMSKSIGLS